MHKERKRARKSHLHSGPFRVRCLHTVRSRAMLEVIGLMILLILLTAAFPVFVVVHAYLCVRTSFENANETPHYAQLP